LWMTITMMTHSSIMCLDWKVCSCEYSSILHDLIIICWWNRWDRIAANG
jgi:hypothetical protein